MVAVARRAGVLREQLRGMNMQGHFGVRVVGLGVFALWTATLAGAQGTAGKPVFPNPFLVEHQVVQTEDGQEVLRTPSVTDYYGGSWIVSVRPDRSRMIVDFARQELIEVRSEQGTYSILSFDRFADLQRRLRRAEGPSGPRTGEAGRAASSPAAESEPEIVVQEVAAGGGAASRASGEGSGPVRRPGVRHARVSVRPAAGESAPVQSVDVWVDGEVKVGDEGMRALRQLEQDVVGAPAGDGQPSASRLVAAAREWGGGGVVVRTERTVTGGARISDEASRLETLPAFPTDLLQVPDGFRRIPHPLEAMVAHAESEAELNRAMSQLPKK